jgi:Zn-dependent oligopeptidase
MLTAASVYQIAKELSDKEMAKLHKMLTTDVQLYQSLKKVKKKPSMSMSDIEMRRRVLTDIFNVDLDKDIKE